MAWPVPEYSLELKASLFYIYDLPDFGYLSVFLDTYEFSDVNLSTSAQSIPFLS